MIEKEKCLTLNVQCRIVIMLPSHIYSYLAPTLSILFQTFRCFYILINVREPGGFYQRIRDKYTEAY